MRILHEHRGFSLIEVLIAISIAAIMISIATTGAGYIQAQRLTSASRNFLGDLQRIRQKALLQSYPLNGSTQLNRGFGIRFIDGTSYVTFEFIDTGATVFQYDDTDEEFEETGKMEGGVRIGPSPKMMTGDVVVTLGDTGNPAGDLIIYDRRGIPRLTNWEISPSKTYVFRSGSASSGPKCVLIDQVRIREGQWNGTSCSIS
jgi:prepilin-type N-terminal cleavage/methylation domain-containing protein